MNNFDCINNFFAQHRLSFSMNSEHTMAFWLLWLWLFMLINSNKILKFILKKIAVIPDEAQLKHKIIAKLKFPLKSIIILTEITPFTDILPGKIGHVISNLVDFAIVMMLVHFVIQLFNEIFFNWFLPFKKGTIIPNVLSFILLGQSVFGDGWEYVIDDKENVIRFIRR